MKYDWNDLAIGESTTIAGDGKKIRTAAAMMGTRHGYWLRVQSTACPQLFKVTRLESPPIQRRQPKEHRAFEQQVMARFERLEQTVHLLRKGLSEIRNEMRELQDR